MAYAKAVVDFSKYADGGMAGPATEIKTKITANAATFPALPMTMLAFGTITATWVNALADSLKGGTDRTSTKNIARTALEDALFQLGTYVNMVADGDQAIIDLSGFPSYTTQRAPSGGAVTFVPENVRWEDGTVGGQEILRWKGDGTRAMYEVQSCIGDPTVAANWTYRGSYSGGRAILNGFTPGATIWGRCRKIGTGGEVGDWSDPAQTMAT